MGVATQHPTQEGATLHVGRCDCSESTSGFCVTGANIVLRLTDGCTCMDEDCGCVAEEQGTLAATELQVIGCLDRGLAAKTGAKVRLHKCIFTQNLNGGVLAVGNPTEVYATDCTFKNNQMHGLLALVSAQVVVEACCRTADTSSGFHAHEARITVKDSSSDGNKKGLAVSQEGEIVIEGWVTVDGVPQSGTLRCTPEEAPTKRSRA